MPATAPAEGPGRGRAGGRPRRAPSAALGLAAFACQALLWGAPAPAHTQGPHAWSTLSGVPEEVDLALVIEDAAGQLGSPQGRALAGALADSGLFDETIGAWTAVAQELRLDPDGVPARVLGRRVTVLLDVVEHRDPPGWLARAFPRVDWAVITDVDRATERLVRERLQAAPREMRHGATVLSVERGKFQLAVSRGADTESARLVFTPSSGGMLDIALAAAKPRPLPPERVGSGLDGGEIVGFARLGAFEPAGAGVTLSWSASRAGTGWRGDLVFDGCPPAGPAGSITEPVFGMLTRDAAAAVLVNEAERSLAAIREAFGAGAPLTGRPVIAGPALTTVFAVPPGATPGEGQPGKLGFQVLATLAPEDAHERFDRLVGTYLVPFESTTARLPDVPAEAGITGPSFGGRLPRAIRRQPVSVNSLSLATVVGSRAEVAWRFAETPGGPMGVLTCTPWRGVDATAATRLTRASAALTEQNPGGPPAGGLTFACLIRPGDFIDAVLDSGQAAPMPAEAFRGVREVRVVIREPEDPQPGRRRGEFHLLMDPARWGDLGTGE